MLFKSVIFDVDKGLKQVCRQRSILNNVWKSSNLKTLTKHLLYKYMFQSLELVRMFKVFEVSSVQLKNNSFKVEFIPVTTLNYSSYFSFTSSFRNHSNMLVWCSRNSSCYYHHCWKLLLLNIFLKTWYILFQDSLMNRRFRRTAFIWSRNLLQ